MAQPKVKFTNVSSLEKKAFGVKIYTRYNNFWQPEILTEHHLLNLFTKFHSLGKNIHNN